MTQAKNDDEYDVVVIDGGATGLDAAVTLGQSRSTDRAVAAR